VLLDRIHHVGYAVADIDSALSELGGRFGMRVDVREVLEDQGVEAAALAAGSSQIELISPLGPEGAVARFLERRGPGLHHVAFAVKDLEAALHQLRADGAELIDEAPRRGLGGHLIAFVHPRSSAGMLTELVQDH
jgi:methylmalonyl-CoA/ethylmalonyl-CoA epimerase